MNRTRLDSDQIRSPPPHLVSFLLFVSFLVVPPPFGGAKLLCALLRFAKKRLSRDDRGAGSLLFLSLSLSCEIFDCVITSSLCCLSYGRVCRVRFSTRFFFEHVTTFYACVRACVLVYTHIHARLPSSASPLASRCRRISLSSFWQVVVPPPPPPPPPMMIRYARDYSRTTLPATSRTRHLLAASPPGRLVVAHQLSRRLSLSLLIMYARPLRPVCVRETHKCPVPIYLEATAAASRETLLSSLFPRRVDFSHLPTYRPTDRPTYSPLTSLSHLRFSQQPVSSEYASIALGVAITFFSAPWQQRRDCVETTL